MTKFNPKDHLIDLRGKAYLPVNQRLVWFREDHPKGSIQTDVVNYAPLVVQARVYSGDGVLLATGHGSANVAQGKTVVWSGREIEKAETAAIGRALGHAGFGTQFDNDDDDLENLADSPLELIGKNTPQSHQEAVSSDLPKAAGDYEPRTPQQALNGNGAKPGQKKDSDTREWTASVVTVRKDKFDKPYLQYTCAEGKPTGRGRDLLRQAGYECESWTVAGETYDLIPSALVTVEKNGNFWNVLSLKATVVSTEAF